MPSWLDFNQIADWVSGAWWSYPLIFAVAMVDAFFPVVPSETVVIIGGNLAASGDLNLLLVILAGAVGAMIGDNISYGIGAWVGERTVKRWFSGEKSLKRLEWAERTLDERGAYIILVGRFIPGGRVAVTFSSGYIPTFPVAALHRLRRRRVSSLGLLRGPARILRRQDVRESPVARAR